MDPRTGLDRCGKSRPNCIRSRTVQPVASRDISQTYANVNFCVCLCFQPDDGYTGRFIMFSVITNIYNKKTKGPILMELFTATGKLKFFFLTTGDVRFVHHW